MVGAQTLEPDLGSNLAPAPTSLGTLLRESGSNHGSELRLVKGVEQHPSRVESSGCGHWQ